MQSPTLGLMIWDGNTRVRTATSGLVRLDQLSGSGPEGQGPPGEKGDQGDPGTVDTSNVYTKLQTDFALMANIQSARLSCLLYRSSRQHR